MPKPSERAIELARFATDGEGCPAAVLDRIARGMDKALEEGRTEPRNLAEAERTYHDAHVVMKQRHGGDRDGEVSYYAVGPLRETLEEAELDLSVWRMRDA